MGKNETYTYRGTFTFSDDVATVGTRAERYAVFSTHVRMIQGRDDLRFLLESLAVFGIKFLNRNDPAEPRVSSFPHFTHPAGPYRREERVRTELCPSDRRMGDELSHTKLGQICERR